MEPTKVVILCGGKGTRSYPFTEYMPKVMMPINGTPIIVHLMRIYASQGFSSFVLAAGHRKEMLFDYFDGRFPEWNIRIVDTGDDADTGDRILRCGTYVGERFFATYGDGLGDLNLHDLLDAHVRQKSLVTMTSVPLRSQYGLVRFDDNNRVIRFEEKPIVKDYWINAGFMVMEREALMQWTGHNLEGQVLPNFARQGQLGVYQHHGFWKSMDTSKDQQELEVLSTDGQSPWLVRPMAAAAAVA